MIRLQILSLWFDWSLEWKSIKIKNQNQIRRGTTSGTKKMQLRLEQKVGERGGENKN